MSDPSADAYIVSGVLPGVQNGAWRWAAQAANLRLHLQETQNWKLVVDLSVADATLKETGPVSISFLVNGREIGRESWEKDGRRRVEKPVPADWLVAGDNSVVIEADKVWVSPQDGNRLGFILTSAGFTR